MFWNTEERSKTNEEYDMFLPQNELHFWNCFIPQIKWNERKAEKKPVAKPPPQKNTSAEKNLVCQSW